MHGENAMTNPADDGNTVKTMGDILFIIILNRLRSLVALRWLHSPSRT
jgi:hypothetical protein